MLGQHRTRLARNRDPAAMAEPADPAAVEWPALPLISGDWRPVRPDLAMTLMIRLCAQVPEAAAICASHDVLALRQRTLTAVRDGLLIEFHTRAHEGGAQAIGALVYRPGLFDLLDGRSAVLHALCDEDAVTLETEEQALEYTQLFCAAVQGGDGCFFPVQPAMLRSSSAHPRLAEQLARAAAPPTARPQGLDWELDLGIAYGATLFRSRFRLQRSGMIEMIDDQHVCAVGPSTAQRWDERLRSSETVAADAIGWPCPICGEPDQATEGADDQVA